MRGDDGHLCGLRGLHLRHEDARIGPSKKVDEIDLPVDRGVHPLHPLRTLTLVLPRRELEAYFFSRGRLGLLDIRREGVRARNRNAEDRLALHAGLSVKRGTGRYELGLL